MKILITGGDGLMGNAFKAIQESYSNDDFIYITRDDCDLLNKEDTYNVIKNIDPQFVIHTAASVGGIQLNIDYPYRQYYDNLTINTNVINGSFLNKIRNVISFSSVCAFPEKHSVLKESNLHDGEPLAPHRFYAYAKRMVDIHNESLNKQYNYNYSSIIPVNIFGPHDNYNTQHGHVIPSLISKFYQARSNNTSVEVWGNGEASREFIYSIDLARTCLELLQLDKMPQTIIASNSESVKIKEIVDTLKQVFKYDNIQYNTNKPVGHTTRVTDNTIFKNTLPNFKFSNLNDSLEESINWYIDNYPRVRT
tara:strand:+ start:8678 stop:9601 length:924 start_codon:yes stop_codon:yes gene_type:complete